MTGIGQPTLSQQLSVLREENSMVSTGARASRFSTASPVWRRRSGRKLLHELYYNQPSQKEQ
jgi:hypothetical protein